MVMTLYFDETDVRNRYRNKRTGLCLYMRWPNSVPYASKQASHAIAWDPHEPVLFTDALCPLALDIPRCSRLLL